MTETKASDFLEEKRFVRRVESRPARLNKLRQWGDQRNRDIWRKKRGGSWRV